VLITTPAFFDNVAPLYPVVDETALRRQIEDYYQGKMPEDSRGWFVLVRLIMCTGLVASTQGTHATHEDTQPEAIVLGDILAGHGAELPHQLLAFGNIISAQILLLIVSLTFMVQK
jgi:hypothetical protein